MKSDFKSSIPYSSSARMTSWVDSKALMGNMISFEIFFFSPRIEWAKLRLSFKKSKLFKESSRALGVAHTVGGLVKVLEDRVAKIADWPTPIDQTGVRGF